MATKKKFTIPEVQENIEPGAAAPVETVEPAKAEDFNDNPLGPILTEAIESQPKVRKKHVHEKTGMEQNETPADSDTSAKDTAVVEKKRGSGLLVLGFIGVAAAFGLAVLSGGKVVNRG